MPATIITSIVTGGTNGHATTSAEANAATTDFIAQGINGVITLNAGSGGTGSFAVNAQGTPAMAVDVSSGSAYISATPSGQSLQTLRAYMGSTYTNYTISSNSSGSTKYDWIYLQVDATKANNPASDASDVTALFTSRSSSNSTDNGSPPTYGLLLAVITVANGASSITNSNVSDKRLASTYRSTPTAGAVNFIDIVSALTATNPITRAIGSDTNIALDLRGKGTSGVLLELRTQTDNNNSISSATTSGFKLQAGWGQLQGSAAATINETVTFPTAFSTIMGVLVGGLGAVGGSNWSSITTATGEDALAVIWLADTLTTASFRVVAKKPDNATNFGSTTRYGYSWIAWGI